MQVDLPGPDTSPAIPAPAATAGTAPVTSVSMARAGRGALWSVLSNGGAQGISLLTFLVTARFVSQAAFGIIAASLTVVELARCIGIEPFAVAVATKRDVRPVDFSACFWLMLGTSVLLAGTTFLLAGPLAGLIGEPRMADALRAISALLLTMGLARTHEAWLIRHMRFRTLAIRAIVASGTGGLVGVTLAVSGFQLWALVAQQIVTALVSLLLLWLTCDWRPALLAPREALIANLRTARHLAVATLGGFLSTQSDIFVASTLLGARATGIYNAAKRITLAFNMVLVSSLQGVTIATFANIAAAEARRSAMLRSAGLVASLTVPASFGIAVLAEDIVRVMLGPRWSGSGPILACLAFGSAATALGQLATAVFLTEGRAELNARCNLANAAANIILLPLAAQLGATALAATVVGIQAMLVPVMLVVGARLAGVGGRALGRAIVRPCLAAAAMALAIGLARQLVALPPLATLTVLIPLGVIVYGVTLAMISPAHLRELFAVARAVTRRDLGLSRVERLLRQPPPLRRP